MKDKLQSLIDTFFSSIDIDKFYSQNQKEKLADWLRENGVIKPPCNVGDTLFYFDDFYKRVREMQVTGIEIVVSCKSSRGSRHAYSSSSFGKTLFHTREALEQALKGGVKK